MLVASLGSHSFLIFSDPHFRIAVFTSVLCTSHMTLTLGSTRARSSRGSRARPGRASRRRCLHVPVGGVHAFRNVSVVPVTAPATGRYTIALESDDGVRLWIDDALQLDDWRGQRDVITVDEVEVDLQPALSVRDVNCTIARRTIALFARTS